MTGIMPMGSRIANRLINIFVYSVNSSMASIKNGSGVEIQKRAVPELYYMALDIDDFIVIGKFG